MELINQAEQNAPIPQTSDIARTVQEVQGSIVVAKKFPRNENAALASIVRACSRKKLAEQAMYAFPRGGQMVTGPSIRLAEAIARSWGNLQYGIREIESNEAETKYEAFCWDIESNVRSSRVFSARHGRWTKKGGFNSVEDPRDVYEIVASNAARRLRACILECIPGDIVDEAVDACEKTLKGQNGADLKDRIRQMVVAFGNIGVTQEMLEDRLGHKIDASEPSEIVSLGKIYNSINNGVSKRSDWFGVSEKPENKEKETINAKFTKSDSGPEPEKNKNEKQTEKQDVKAGTKESNTKQFNEFKKKPEKSDAGYDASEYSF